MQKNYKNQDPSKLGYRMPAEWEKHSATWLAWPHNKETWENIGEVEKTYLEIIRALHTGEKVNILVNDANSKDSVKEKLSENKINIKNIFFYVIPTVDAWIRDYGPNFVIKKNNKSKIAFNHWQFNAWGSKYEDLKRDYLVPKKINEFLRMLCFKPEIVLEGGSIEVNGNGICMTTEQCLLNKNRNPNLSKAEIEQHLKDYLGGKEIIWLKSGIEGDDTDGHIDNIARFVNKNTVLCSFAEETDKNYDALGENFEILNSYKQNNEKLRILRLPLSEVEYKEKRLPASYTNFYIGNYAVLVPLFQNKNDKRALKILKSVFPGRKIVGIDCRELVCGFGGIHCITQQQPMV